MMAAISLNVRHALNVLTTKWWVGQQFILNNEMTLCFLEVVSQYEQFEHA